MQNNGVRYGIIISLVHIIIILGVYFLMTDLMFSGWFGMVEFFGLFIIGISLAVAQEKQDNDGFIEFKDAFKTALIVISIFAVTSAIFGYLLFNVIDPGLNEMNKAKAIEMMANWLSPDQMENYLDTVKEEDFIMTPGKTIMGAGVWILLGSIVGLIVSGIMRNPKPIHMREDDVAKY